MFWILVGRRVCDSAGPLTSRAGPRRLLRLSRPATAPRRTAAPYAAERGSPPRRRCTDRCDARWLPRGAGLSRRCTVSSPRPPGAVPVGARAPFRCAFVGHHTTNFRTCVRLRRYSRWAAGRWRDARADFGKHRPAASFPQDTGASRAEEPPIPGTFAPARTPASVAVTAVHGAGEVGGFAGTVLPLDRPDPGIDQAATRVLAAMTSPMTTAAPRSMVREQPTKRPGGAEASGRYAGGRGRSPGRSIDPHHS